MPFLTEVHFQNYRSFLDAKCRLSPVTLVIGANNAGKSNFLRGIRALVQSFKKNPEGEFADIWDAHHRRKGMEAEDVRIRGKGLTKDGRMDSIDLTTRRVDPSASGPEGEGSGSNGLDLREVYLYQLDESKIGGPEMDSESPFVHGNGEGTTRVLQALLMNDRDVFEEIEATFREFVPEVEKVKFKRAEQGKHFVTVSEAGVEEPVAVTELSNGSRTILALLTILHQPRRPDLILIEDIEHAIHPQGLEPLMQIIRAMAKKHGVQFIMTTQSPFMLDCFQEEEYWADVVIVEKKDGVSRLANMDDRLKRLGYATEKDKVPLGDLWFSGLLGGVSKPPEPWDRDYKEGKA